ncbi:MAG TPA: hypothetical protein DCK93_11980 [Blastocatellia bacterium]|nr:hypothetical protein [Blastocatellia bacterium]HAF23607.1 hypothetical protein [Blastocatellia bacterium]
MRGGQHSFALRVSSFEFRVHSNSKPRTRNSKLFGQRGFKLEVQLNDLKLTNALASWSYTVALQVESTQNSKRETDLGGNGFVL